MKCREIVENLINGYKLKLPCDDSIAYIHWPKDSEVVRCSDGMDYIGSLYSSSGWKIYEEVKIELKPEDIGHHVKCKNGMITILVWYDPSESLWGNGIYSWNKDGSITDHDEDFNIVEIL